MAEHGRGTAGVGVEVEDGVESARAPDPNAGGDPVQTGDAVFHAAFAAAPAGAAIMDLDGRFLRVNAAFERITGYRESELRSRRIFDLIHPDDVAATRQEAKRLLNAGACTPVLDHRYVTRSGGWVWVRATIAAVRDGRGTPTHLVLTGEDVSERVQASRRTQQLGRVATALTSAITSADVAGVVVEQGVEALSATAGAIYRLSADGTLLELLQTAGQAAHEMEEWTRLPVSESSPLTESAKTGEPIFLEGERFRHEAHAGPWHLTPHCAAAAVLPLVAEGQVWGVISVSYAHDHDRSPGDQTQFDAETRGFTMAVAQHCAQALERARLYEAEQRARTDAEAARAEAESANAAKSEFLAAMSHEIRTPINAIQGYAQLLELGLVGPVTEQQRICLGRLSSSTQHLLGLVDDVLDLAKVDAGQMHIARESAPIARAIATALDLTRPLAAARGIGVSDLTPTDAKLEYQGDEHRVRQILVNLLSNAIKFTSSGGTVSITAGVEYEVPPAARVRGSGPWVFSRVADTGIGIPPREHSHVFDAFHQVERGTTRTRGGTGLGLTISRRLARLMDGDVTLESAPGVGSTFTLWLPATSRTVGRTTAATPQASDLHTPGLRELGDLLRLRAPRIVEVFVDRVRADPMIAEARRVRGSQLEDHLGSILMDFAQSLIIVGDAGLDAATLLRDGTAIQRAVGEQHGARRHAQGWRFSALRREQEILREAIAEAVHAEGARARAGPGDATAVLFHLIDRSAAISLRAWQRAADRGVSESADIVAADAPEIPAAWPGQPSDRTTERQTSPPGHDQEVPQSAERDQLG